MNNGTLTTALRRTIKVYEENAVKLSNRNKAALSIQLAKQMIDYLSDKLVEYGGLLNVGVGRVTVQSTCGLDSCDNPIKPSPEYFYYESDIDIDGAPDGDMHKDMLYFCSDWCIMQFLYHKEAICPHREGESVIDHLAQEEDA